MGMSENMVYSQWNSHLVGIMIMKTIGFFGVHYFQTNPDDIQKTAADVHDNSTEKRSVALQILLLKREIKTNQQQNQQPISYLGVSHFDDSQELHVGNIECVSRFETVLRLHVECATAWKFWFCSWNATNPKSFPYRAVSFCNNYQYVAKIGFNPDRFSSWFHIHVL